MLLLTEKKMRLTVDKNIKLSTAGIRRCDSCGLEERLKKPRQWSLCKSCERVSSIASGKRPKPPIQVKRASYINYCQCCSKAFEVRSKHYQHGPNEQKFCSYKCMGSQLLGKSPANKMYDRKDMAPRLVKLGPKGENEHAWRREILKKRNFVCEISGQKGRLVVHHIVPFKVNPELQFCESNVVVITAEIHRKFHIEKMGGWNKPYTIEDWNDFVLKQKELIDGI